MRQRPALFASAADRSCSWDKPAENRVFCFRRNSRRQALIGCASKNFHARQKLPSQTAVARRQNSERDKKVTHRWAGVKNVALVKVNTASRPELKV